MVNTKNMDDACQPSNFLSLQLEPSHFPLNSSIILMYLSIFQIKKGQNSTLY